MRFFVVIPSGVVVGVVVVAGAGCHRGPRSLLLFTSPRDYGLLHNVIVVGNNNMGFFSIATGSLARPAPPSRRRTQAAFSTATVSRAAFPSFLLLFRSHSNVIDFFGVL